MQAGIIFGLPKEQAMIGDDAAIDKTIKAPSNITVTYTTSADWIQLEPKDQQLRVIVAETPRAAPARAGSSPRVSVSLTHFRSRRSISPTS